MRLGFFAGFLIGAIIASVNEDEGAEAIRQAADIPDIPEEEPKGIIDKLKRHVRQAIDEGRKASAEKQAEMLREFEDAKSAARNRTSYAV